MSESNPTGNRILSLALRDKAALRLAYMPQLRNGGLFVPTSQPFTLGDEVFLLVKLFDDPARTPVAGRVAWITPSGAKGGRPAGVGVQFSREEGPLKVRLEGFLAGMPASQRPTHTL